MASTDARPIPQKNVAYRVYFPIMDNTGALVTAATIDSGLASGSGKALYSGDAVAAVNSTNSVTEVSGLLGQYYLDLTATEMNKDAVILTIRTTTANAKNVPIALYPEEAGDIRVNVTAYGGTAGTFAAGIPEVKVASIAAGAIAAATFAANALDAVWSTATRLLTAGTNIVLAKGTGVTGFTDIDAPGVRTATGLAAANLDTQLGAIAGYIDTEVAAIKTKTDQLTFTVANKVDSNPTAINGDATSAANLAKTTRAIGRGTVTAAASTTSIPTSAFSPSGVATDQFKGRIITFDADTTTTALRGQSTDITASSLAATPTFTVTALTTAPASGDTFSVT